MSASLKHLNDCVAMLLTEVRELRQEIKAGPPEGGTTNTDPPRPLTALDLCERWHFAGSTPEALLYNLAKKARHWGLRALKGTRGWDALYGRADVLHAEHFAGGKLKRRKHAA